MRRPPWDDDDAPVRLETPCFFECECNENAKVKPIDPPYPTTTVAKDGTATMLGAA